MSYLRGSTDVSGYRLPNLLIIGAMKSSTTLLYEMLRRHPQIYFSREKEPHYFTQHFANSGAWEDYLALFEGCPQDARYVGEASTGYTKLPWLGPTPQRIRERLGAPRMIYVLRDPVARAVSNFRHSYTRGFYPEGTTFSAVVDHDPIVVAASRYATQLRAYVDEFGEGAVLTLIAEDLHDHPSNVMSDVEQYLDLAPFDGWTNQGASPRVANSAESVRVSAGWDRLLGRTITKTISNAAPAWAKRAVKRAYSPPVPQPPAVTEADEQRCLDQLRDDLEDLYSLLGDRIARWPSVKKLGLAQPMKRSAIQVEDQLAHAV